MTSVLQIEALFALLLPVWAVERESTVLVFVKALDDPDPYLTRT